MIVLKIGNFHWHILQDILSNLYYSAIYTIQMYRMYLAKYVSILVQNFKGYRDIQMLSCTKINKSTRQKN